LMSFTRRRLFLALFLLPFMVEFPLFIFLPPDIGGIYSYKYPLSFLLVLIVALVYNDLESSYVYMVGGAIICY
jgi:hypothetical protein